MVLDCKVGRTRTHRRLPSSGPLPPRKAVVSRHEAASALMGQGRTAISDTVTQLLAGSGGPCARQTGGMEAGDRIWKFFVWKAEFKVGTDGISEGDDVDSDAESGSLQTL